MRDPHTHVEHDIDMMTHQEMRELIVKVTGLACSMPKTVRTGCDRRRPLAMTSVKPEAVTCLACREYAVAVYLRQARDAELCAEMMDADPDFAAGSKTGADGFRAMAGEYRAMAGAMS